MTAAVTARKTAYNESGRISDSARLKYRVRMRFQRPPPPDFQPWKSGVAAEIYCTPIMQTQPRQLDRRKPKTRIGCHLFRAIRRYWNGGAPAADAADDAMARDDDDVVADAQLDADVDFDVDVDQAPQAPEPQLPEPQIAQPLVPQPVEDEPLAAVSDELSDEEDNAGAPADAGELDPLDFNTDRHEAEDADAQQRELADAAAAAPAAMRTSAFAHRRCVPDPLFTLNFSVSAHLAATVQGGFFHFSPRTFITKHIASLPSGVASAIFTAAIKALPALQAPWRFFIDNFVMLVSLVIVMTFSSHNLPYAAADSLFEGFQRILCIFSVVLPTTVRQFFLRTNIQHMLDERETLIICPNPKCCKVYRRSACSTIHDDIGERTNTCSNYPFGRGKKICGTPLLVMTKRGSQWYCHSKPSQELIYMGVIRPLERLLQSQIFVDHIWDHLQWQRVDGLYRGVFLIWCTPFSFFKFYC